MRLRARSRGRAPSYDARSLISPEYKSASSRSMTLSGCLGAGSYLSSVRFSQRIPSWLSSLHEHSSEVTALRTAFGYEQETDWYSHRSWRPKRWFLQWEMEARRTGVVRSERRGSGRVVVNWEVNFWFARDSGETGVLAVQGSCEARVLSYPPKGVAADCVLHEVSMAGVESWLLAETLKCRPREVHRNASPVFV